MSGSGVRAQFNETGTLAATGSSPGFLFSHPFNLTLSGTWVGSVAVEASPDEGATWVNCPMPDGTYSALTANGFYPAPNVWQRGIQFRVTFTRTSGTLAWRLSQ